MATTLSVLYRRKAFNCAILTSSMGFDLSNRIRMMMLSFSKKPDEKLGEKCDELDG